MVVIKRFANGTGSGVTQVLDCTNDSAFILVDEIKTIGHRDGSLNLYVFSCWSPSTPTTLPRCLTSSLPCQRGSCELRLRSWLRASTSLWPNFLLWKVMRFILFFAALSGYLFVCWGFLCGGGGWEGGVIAMMYLQITCANWFCDVADATQNCCHLGALQW